MRLCSSGISIISLQHCFVGASCFLEHQAEVFFKRMVSSTGQFRTGSQYFTTCHEASLVRVTFFKGSPSYDVAFFLQRSLWKSTTFKKRYTHKTCFVASGEILRTGSKLSSGAYHAFEKNCCVVLRKTTCSYETMLQRYDRNARRTQALSGYAENLQMASQTNLSHRCNLSHSQQMSDET